MRVRRPFNESRCEAAITFVSTIVHANASNGLRQMALRRTSASDRSVRRSSCCGNRNRSCKRDRVGSVSTRVRTNNGCSDAVRALP